MSGSKFVFCEGKDDVAVLTEVALSIGIADLQIEEFSGRNKLRGFLRDVQKRPEFAQQKVAVVGIVRDADEDGDAAFQSVRDSLIANDFSAPTANGAVTEGTIRVGILILGPNGGQGMLEDLCLQSVSDQPEFSCVDEYFRCVAEKSTRSGFSSKARVRAWMAVQPDFDLRVGKAAEKGYWPWESPAFNPIKEFLRAL